MRSLEVQVLALIAFVGMLLILIRVMRPSTVPPGQFPIDQVDPPKWPVTYRVLNYAPSRTMGTNTF